MATVPLLPKHPERICWGCLSYCKRDDLSCGNGSIRTPHPIEIGGADWLEWANENGIDVGTTDPSDQDPIAD